MASHGGFIGVILATLWYAKKSHQSFWPIADLIAGNSTAWVIFGRIANFINGELWGRKTDISWGVLFPQAPSFALRALPVILLKYMLHYSRVLLFLFMFNSGFGNLIFAKIHRADWEENSS